MFHSSVQGYMAHGNCFLWDPPLVWLHVSSDIVTGLAYYSITIALFYFAYKRRDVPFLSMFVLFGVFIFSCGTTHLLAAYTVFVPIYWKEGIVKAFTAVASAASAFLFIPLLPKAIALPSLTRALDEIKLLNKTLENQVDELRIKESALASSTNAIAFADLTGRLTYVNNAFLELWGYDSNEEVLNKPVSSFLDSAEQAESLVAKVRENNNWAGELPAKRNDGSIFVSELKWSTVLGESGNPICLMGLFADITERRNNEEALRTALKKVEDEKAKSEAIIGAIGDGISIQDADFTVIYQNQVSKNLMGDHIGEHCYAVYDRNDMPCKGCPVEMSLKDGGIHTLERSTVTDEEIKYYEITTSALRDSGGKIIAGIEVVRDLTERKKGEDELRLFKNLINQANDAIFVVDPTTGRFLDVNVKASRNLGYTREELLGLTVSDIDDLVTPDPTSWSANVDNIKARGYVFLEGEHRRKDGTTYPVEANVKYISLEKRDYMLAVARDITERKKADEALQKSEKKYQDLFESTLDGIYQIDADGVFIMMNPAGAKMFGYDSPDEIIGRKGLDFWRDPKDRDVFRAELKTKKSVSGYHMRLKKKNGEPVEIETSSTIKENKQGTFLGMEGVLRDVTERKKLEAQLFHAQKMEAVGTLAGGIAHDFNNILNVIIGYGNMLLDNLGSDSTFKDQMNEVLTAAERAATLTRRLLAFSRKQVVAMKPVNVNELIADIQKMLARIIGEDIDFNLDLSGRSPLVMADAGQIEQVLMNLAANARDAMPNGGRLTIHTGLQIIDDEYVAVNGYGELGTYALITVADTGGGMDEETRKKIFEPFFTTKGIGEGTGLGLAISYGIIKQHGGYIKVYSERRQGTIFKIYLPLIEKATAPDMQAEIPDAPTGGSETVLVAEDDASLRKLASIVLESSGYRVIPAQDGEDAVNKFMEDSERIDLVMLDMIMPKRNGKEVSEVLRKVRPGIKILFTSGYTMDIVKNKELTASGIDFIHKPVLPKDLLRKVREILDR